MKRPFMMCFEKSSANIPRNVILTGPNDDGSLASFNIPSSTGEERLDRVRISRRADPGVFVASRAVIPNVVNKCVFKPAESLPPP